MCSVLFCTILLFILLTKMMVSCVDDILYMTRVGLASNTMSIDQLKLGASVIFIRAFEAIYKTIITDKIIRPMNKADHAANAELFLKALRDITDNPDLDGLTGFSIADGVDGPFKLVVKWVKALRSVSTDADIVRRLHADNDFPDSVRGILR